MKADCRTAYMYWNVIERHLCTKYFHLVQLFLLLLLPNCSWLKLKVRDISKTWDSQQWSHSISSRNIAVEEKKTKGQMLDKLSTAIQLPSPSCERSNGTCYYLYIVMCNNIFQWGDMYFHQKCGTARGYLISLYWDVGCGLQYTLQFTKTTPYY